MIQSDFYNFTSMLENAGYKFTVEENAVCRFKQKDTGKVLDMHGTTNVTVDGTFYDQLYAEFDDEGFLLALSSHVAYCPEETAAIQRCTLPVTKRGEKPNAK